ncbi:Demethylmenaquinone methyltransferase [compost metagenome]
MNMERKHQAEQATRQSAIWNGDAGNAWVDTQELIEHMFKPIEDILVGGISDQQQVLDVGCGTGSTSMAVSRLLDARGTCTGIDISEQMIAAARIRAEREELSTHFICADAQTYPFAAASFDLIISRFGVMFFDDFDAAFKQLRVAARDQAELKLIVWRSPEENPFMTTAEHAARTLLPDIPQRTPDEPGQFGLANPQRIQSILQQSGWADINIAALDVACSFPERGLTHYLSRMGPLGRILQQHDEHIRKQVIASVRAAFEPYVDGDAVRFTAACWQVSARAL